MPKHKRQHCPSPHGHGCEDCKPTKNQMVRRPSHQAIDAALTEAIRSHRHIHAANDACTGCVDNAVRAIERLLDGRAV